MANLVDMPKVLKFLGLDTQTTADKNLELIRDGVEDWIQNVFCHRILTTANYKEKYDGSGDRLLILDQYPVTEVNRLSVDFDNVFWVKNSATTGHCSVSYNGTNLVLNKDGTKTNLAVATYTTMTLMVAAINAQSANGWSAALRESSYGAYLANTLAEKYGLQCVNGAEVDMEMPKLAEWDFEVDAAKGIINSPYSFPEGYRNIYIDYDAGFSTIPEDLQLATMILIKNIYQRRSEESFGATNYSISGISVAFEQDMPVHAKHILGQYRKVLL